ncbi:hypothetical protein KAR91_01165 [Candidatus Pacearchaeota archaeon]|nr:hypothetical protein [Candidatus Pacearchaeota archaeon]
MKVAVFTSRNEVVVLQVKGNTKSKQDIDGYDEWFGPNNRDVTDYDVDLGFIGAGSGISISSRVNIGQLDKKTSIEDWFEEYH